jgi:hypothetical protein
MKLLRKLQSSIQLLTEDTLKIIVSWDVTHCTSGDRYQTTLVTFQETFLWSPLSEPQISQRHVTRKRR